jgi:UDP-N-acetylmuramoylalanine--D-glutamate ligase
LKKRIVILGAGESGVGAAILAAKQEFDVFVSDRGKIKDKYKNVLYKSEIPFEEGKHTESLILNAGEVIKSPGISDNVKIIKKLHKMGINVISEIEFAARYTNAKLICITGSNGKTTTTLLTWHIMKKAGINVGLGGNIGQSFALQVAEKEFDYWVLEISSFQLDGMFDFKADIAVLTNITPDHLDRYDNKFENYVQSKFRIIQNQTADDAFIYCADDPVINAELKKRKIKAKQFPFSIQKELKGNGAFIKASEILFNIKPNTFTMTLENLALQGRHNIYNSMAAGIATKYFNINKDVIKKSLSDFKNVEHRLEFVARIHGVEFINDSKATNVNAAWFALESMNSPVVWIAGGVDKGNDYDILKELVQKKVKAIVCLGKDCAKIKEAFSDIVEIIAETTSMEEAVHYGLHLSNKEDIVLLSPACASFDLFENFGDRGDQFKKEVRNL